MEVIKTAIDGVFIWNPVFLMMQEGISLKASQDVNLKKKYAGLHLYRIMRVSLLTVYYGFFGCGSSRPLFRCSCLDG